MSALGGIALTLGATALFASLDTATKLVLTTVPLMMALWFRYFVQAVTTTVILVPRRGWRIGYTGRPGLHLLRGLAGALIIIRPGAESFSAMMLLPLLVLAANSSFQLLTSHMVRTEDPMTMHLYTGWIGTLVTSLALPWAWAQLSGLEWARMLVMGLSAAIGHFLLILAYGRTPVAVMAPYLYAQIAFAVVGGWLVFSHTPDGWALLGMCVIGLCGATGAWLILRQNRMDRTAQVLAPDPR